MNQLRYSTLCVGLFLATLLSAQKYHEVNKKTDTYTLETGYEVVEVDKLPKFSKKPKNIIFLIGDGMGTAQVTAALTANKGKLNMAQFPYSGFHQTQSADRYITDSAAGGTAMACGKRTKNGVIGMDENLSPVKSILEIAEDQKMATGLVSTSGITHATPASFIAHQPNRNMYEEIAADFLKTDIEVFIGGGQDHFSKRKDKRNLLNELSEKGYCVAFGMDDILNCSSNKLAGFIASGHGPRQMERGEMLVKSTEKAIDILSQDKDGFFLMVEGSQIDWGGHANDMNYVVTEASDFDRAVGVALKFALKNKNTLVVVTADHETGGLTLVGGAMEKGTVKGNFGSKHHTAVMVPVFTIGPGAELFSGIQKNTDLFYKMKDLIEQ